MGAVNNKADGFCSGCVSVINMYVANDKHLESVLRLAKKRGKVRKK